MKLRNFIICSFTAALLGPITLAHSTAITDPNLTLVTLEGSLLNDAPGIKLVRTAYHPSTFASDLIPPPSNLSTKGITFTLHLVNDHNHDITQNYRYTDVANVNNWCDVTIVQHPDASISPTTIAHGAISCVVRTANHVNTKSSIGEVYILAIGTPR